MNKNGLLQTFFYDFLKIQVTNYGSFEEMKKGTSAIHGATFFFYQKGHGVAPFYFSLDKTLHYLQMCMKEYGCCPIFKRGDNSTYSFTKRGGCTL